MQECKYQVDRSGSGHALLLTLLRLIFKFIV
jgi:hypothetical protein